MLTLGTGGSRNIGAPANWNFVAQQARGRFFKWASASDICAPRFLEACMAPMLTDDSIVLCFGKTSYDDEAGDPVAIGKITSKRSSRNLVSAFDGSARIFR